MSAKTIPQREERWLDCQLDKGMFSDEVAVTYPSTGTWRASVFVPQTAVEGDIGSRGRVRVEVLRRNGKMLAVLPSPQRDLVEVVEADLSTK